MSVVITKTAHGKYQLKLYDRVKQAHVCICDTIEDADEKASEIELKFYKENPIYLPHGVSVADKLFVLYITTETVTRPKFPRRVGSAKRLHEIIRIKQMVVSSLIY